MIVRTRHTLGGIADVPSSGPYFMPDLSSYQGAAPNFDAIAATPRMVGAILKTSQGLGPGTNPGASPQWFQNNWNRLRTAGGSRYGSSWFRGVYHFGSPTSSGAAQADYMMSAVDRGGGWGDGDMPPAWDLEGALWTSAQQIVDVSSQFASRVKQLTGKSPILYTGATWRQFKITNKAGFGQMWSSHLNVMEPYGWPNSSYALWQYAGDGKYYNPATAVFGYPTAVGGMPTLDMNVVMDGGAAATSIDRVRTVLTGRGGLLLPLLLGGLFVAGYLIAKRFPRAAH